MSAQVTTYSLIDSNGGSGGGGEIYYHITLVLGGKTFLSKRRYSHFLSFQTFIQKTFKSNIVKAVELPPKKSITKFISSFTLLKGGMDTFNKERQESLNTFIKKLSENASPIFWKHPRVEEFFNIKKITNIPLKDWNLLTEKVESLLAAAGGKIGKENKEKIDSILTILSEGLEYHKIHSTPSEYTELSLQYQKLVDRHSNRNSFTGVINWTTNTTQKITETTQEQKLNQISERLKVHKELGLAIEEEVNQQNMLIDSLRDNANDTQNKMSIADSRMKRVNGK